MGAYWSSLASGVLPQAAGIMSDMLPVIAILGGLAIAERVISMIRRNV